jgi:hypothetical protein
LIQFIQFVPRNVGNGPRRNPEHRQ